LTTCRNVLIIRTVATHFRDFFTPSVQAQVRRQEIAVRAPFQRAVDGRCGRAVSHA